jgi:TIR domain/PAN domain
MLWYPAAQSTFGLDNSMASLADAPDLVGFFSYSREDDEDSGGRLSELRERIQAELRGQLGRTKRDFRLWQDKTAIAHGELWEDRIKTAICESVFFIPIITPTAVRSHHCKFEFDSFLAREKELGRSNLVFPILYIPVPALTDDRWRQDPLLSIIGSRQYAEWQHLRHLDASSTEVRREVGRFCANISSTLQQPWLSPQERREAEARQQAEEERRRQEKLQEEARQRAEEERHRQEKLQQEAQQRAEEARRREEAETKRRLDEAEAEKRRQDKERRKLEKEAAWAGKKERLHRWRGAAAGAAVVALLMVGGIWLYRTTTPTGVTSAVVEAQRKANEAEEQRLAAVKAEEERRAKAEAEAAARSAVVPQSAPTNSKGLFEIRSKMEGTGRFDKVSYAPSIDACEQNCAQSNECQTFTFATKRGACFLYYRPAALQPNEYFDSGIRFPTSTTGRFIIRTNTEAVGFSQETYPRYVPSKDNCEQNCARSADCKVFAYNKDTGMCYKYTQTPSAAPNPFAPNEKFDTGIRN